MEPIFHTIALEPNRWKPARVSRPLLDLLPAIRQLGLRDLEVYEPHLLLAPDEAALSRALVENQLTPLILSSYLDLNPAGTSEADLEPKMARLVDLVGRYGFRRVRIFAGLRMSPDDVEGAKIFTARLATLAARLPETEFLVETHDLSLADDPALIFNLVKDLGRDNVALLFQPTVFEQEAALAQFRLQQPLVRHIHLQNRNAKDEICLLAEGKVDWRRILAAAGPGVTCTLEFIPAGICPEEDFDLETALRQVREETEFIRSL